MWRDRYRGHEEHSVIGRSPEPRSGETRAEAHLPLPGARYPDGNKGYLRKSGTAKELITYFGLDAQSIAENAKAAIALKNNRKTTEYHSAHRNALRSTEGRSAFSDTAYAGARTAQPRKRCRIRGAEITENA